MSHGVIGLLVGVCTAMALAGCCPKKGKRLPPAPAEPLSGASTPRAWPLPQSCETTMCMQPNGEPGVRCAASEPCQNPCPSGMGPEAGGSFCARLCKRNADCGSGKCAGGVCNTWPEPLPCESAEFCELPGGATGMRCKATDGCRSTCKKGLVLYGGTHCAKPCKSNADCPGGECDVEGHICGPLCPSEGCPYRWE